MGRGPLQQVKERVRGFFFSVGWSLSCQENELTPFEGCSINYGIRNVQKKVLAVLVAIK